MEVFDTVAPVFFLIGVGALLFRRFLDEAFLRNINWLTYWVGLPALIFDSISRADLAEPLAGKVLVVVFAATILTLLAGFGAARLLGVSVASGGTFLQASFRGNLAFIGVPVVIFAYPGSETASTVAILTLGPMMLLYNVLSIPLLQRSRDGGKGGFITRKLIRSLVSNPLIIASLAAVLFSFSGLGLPFILERSVGVLGQMALPLALLSIGGALVVVKVKGRFTPAMGASLLKVAFCPLIGLFCARLIGLEGESLGVALILLAAPTAAASYIIAQQFEGDERLASGAIVISTVLSILSLSAAVAMA